MRPILLVIFGIGALLLRVGFALQASGSLRAKNASSAILRSAADTAAATVAFWFIGAGILFQHYNGWLGFDRRFICNVPAEFACDEFFHMAICAVGSAVVTGALAERASFRVSQGISATLGGVVFPMIGHCIWFGKLHDWNFIDFGGATAIHLPAAIFAAVGVAVIGSRAGKYDRDGASASIAGHSLPMIGMGVLLIFTGWFPYLLGCIGAHWSKETAPPDEIAFGISATNILLAGASGLTGGLWLSYRRYKKPDLFFALSGMLGALVAITPGFVAVPAYGAVVMGFVAGILVPLVATMLDSRAHLDDPVGLIAIHGTGAIWGTLATAMLVYTDRFSDHFRLLAIQAGGLAAVSVISFMIAVGFFTALKTTGSLRVLAGEEIEGLDLAEHEVRSYSDV